MEETKILLYETGKILLKKNTIEKISVSDIIREAKVSRPTFYRYFKDKYDLANSLLDYMMQPLIDRFKNDRDFETYFRNSCLVIHDEFNMFKNIYVNSDNQNSFQSYLIETNIKSFESFLNVNKLTEQQRFQLYLYVYGSTLVNWKTITGEIKMNYHNVLEYSINSIPDFLKSVLQI